MLLLEVVVKFVVVVEALEVVVEALEVVVEVEVEVLPKVSPTLNLQKTF